MSFATGITFTEQNLGHGAAASHCPAKKVSSSALHFGKPGHHHRIAVRQHHHDIGLNRCHFLNQLLMYRQNIRILTIAVSPSSPTAVLTKIIATSAA